MTNFYKILTILGTMSLKISGWAMMFITPSSREQAEEIKPSDRYPFKKK